MPSRITALTLLLLGGPVAAGAATITVDTFENASTQNGNCSLVEALFAAISDTSQDACIAGSGADVIVLAAPGSYLFNSEFPVNGQTLTVRGNPALGTAADFVVELGFIGRFLGIGNGADVTLEHLTLIRGEPHFEFGGCLVARESSLTIRDAILQACVAPTGGALFFRGSGTDRLVVERTTFRDNRARFVVGSGGQRQGGAVGLDLNGTSSAVFRDVLFDGNQADCLGTDCDSAFGGALMAFQFDTSALTLSRVRFTGNRIQVDPEDVGIASAVFIQAGAGPTVIEDGWFTGNGLDSTGGSLSASVLSADCGGPARLDRLRFVGNDPGPASGTQVDVRASVHGMVELTNVLVARGPDHGLFLQASGNAQLVAGNLTVTGHATQGITAFLAQPTATLRLENSIVWGNGTDAIETFGTTPTLDPSNFIGLDPHFVNAAVDNYDLTLTSPCRDNGNGTLSTVKRYDALHRVRIVGPTIDRGALEWNALFSDDFDAGDAGAWTLHLP